MFKKIYLEITNRCNLACEFCLPTGRARADMAPTAFAALLPQVRPFTDHLALHVLGEPLLHPQLEELLAICHHQGMQVNLTSNGTLLSRHAAMLLAAPALRQVNISLHSSQGQPGRFEIPGYLAEVLAFARLAATRGIFVSLRIWNLPSGSEPTGRCGHEALLTKLAEFFAVSGPLVAQAAVGQGVKLTEKVFLSQKQLFAWPTLSGPDLGGSGSCRGLRDQVAILVDGTVVPCCLDAEGNIALGNVFKEPFGEIVGGERANRIKKGFRERRVLEALCRRCSYRQRF